MTDAEDTPVAEPVSMAEATLEPAAAESPAAPARLQGPTAYAICLAVIVADQLIKQWILYAFQLPVLGSVQVLGPFHLTMVWNQGVSFGLFRGEAEWVRWALAAFSLGVAGFLGVWARQVERPLLGGAIGLVMGGAIGNLIDRVRFGAVADFIDFKALHFPWVFNIADSAITIGVVLLLIDSIGRDAKR
ncbi:MAG TPA: signal peptidase II [Caulobacter sp.]|nr:signal peptidase II [Caulobacter sp.]